MPVANIKGPTGPTGATVTGPTGPTSTVTGPAGATVTGPTGPTGTGPTGIGFTTSATGAQTSVTAAAADTQLLAAAAGRRGCSIFNDSKEVLYLLLEDAVASSTNYTVKMAAAGYYEGPYNYTGKVKGIWASENGAARITEFT